MKGLTRKMKLWLRKSSPTILSFLAAGGVVGTTVLAVKATPKAVKKLKEKNLDKQAMPRSRKAVETVLTCWPCYIPTCASGLATIVCIFGANTLSKKNQAALLSAYAMLDQSYKSYRHAAKEVYGEDADDKIRAVAAKEMIVDANGYRVYAPELDNSDKVLFYDVYSNRYFTSTLAAVINAQYHLNRNFALGKDCSVNDFYEFLGLEKATDGDDVGWPSTQMFEDGIMWIDFDNCLTKLDDGMECYVITSMYEPLSFLE